MRLDVNKLSSAVRLALSLGVVAAAGTVTANAQDTGTTGNTNQKSQALETIVVTGSNIRRVDIETANPVVTIDRQQIQNTGKLTVGDLVQDLPSMAGAATNPSVNNGGGTGASTVSLRGLGSERTLLLLNGRRLAYNDLNSIPINLIERIEVLKEGAAAVYGSDAIGGVVNIITRKDYQGIDASVDYGISDHDDGQRRGFSMTMGQTSDRGNILLGVNYNKQEQVAGKDRKFSSAPLYNYFGNIYILGSSRIPNGQFTIPNSLAQSYGLNCGSGNVVQVTRGSGDGTSPSDYRCYIGGGPNNDTYNYNQEGNVELTPQERGGIFVSGSYKVTDNVEVYAEALSEKTHSAQIIAPLPFILGTDSGVTISKDSIYNPFGVDITSGARRMSAIGNRSSSYSTSFDQFSGGLRGSFANTWSWDAGITWGRVRQPSVTTGHFFNAGLAKATGPSFIDANGVPRCGTPDAIIAGCTPVSLVIDYNTPEGQQQLDILRGLRANTTYQSYSTEKTAQFNVTGEVMDLPAGAMSLAVGGDYIKDYQYYQPDFVALITDPANGTCLTDRDSCASPNTGELSRREFYAELFVPILRDMFLAKSLNVTVGARYSDYSAFNSTTNSKIGVEWHPIDDLLVRGTVSQVFRSPTISDLFGGVTPSADTYRDPCNGLTQGDPRASNPACAGIPTSPGSVFNQPDSQTSALFGSNPDLTPEKGRVFTYGFVYNPQWLEGFSTTVDVWRVYLNNTIGQIGTQTIIDQCFNSGQFCNLFTRDTAGLGDINHVENTTQNIGRIDTDGVDIGFNYRLPTTAWGNFRFNFDSTYINKYNNRILAGDITTQSNYAGAYQSSSQGGNGNFSRWRALATANWNMGAFDASWSTRFVDGFRFGSVCQTQPGSYQVVCPDNNADLGHNGFKVGAYTMHNLQFGYNIEPISTRIDVGVDNVFDKQPPLLYQFGFNGSVDERTFDVVGRYFWTRLSVKF